MVTFNYQKDPFTAEEYVEVPLKGQFLIEHPIYNKGTAFPADERKKLELCGLLPENVSTMELQKQRAYEAFEGKTDDLEKYIYMLALQDRNETLYYALILDHLREMLPIVYTPTVGKACQQFSHIYRRNRGLYVSANQIDNIDSILSHAPFSNVSLIVVTDGERILGLGDQGSDGMGIPIGKISLYVAAAGIHPAFTLPVLIDVGTNNEERLADPLYLGLREKRLTGEAYDAVIEAFVTSVRRNFPNALLQWEDFGKNNAFRLLERYRERICSFNDDIQGTGAVAMAAFLSAMKIKKQRLSDQRFVLFGQGQAGLGIGRAIMTGLMADGLSEKEAKARIFGVDIEGLLVEGMTVTEEQKLFMKERAAVADWKLSDPNRIGLLDTIKNARATVLVGVTGQSGAFDEQILSQMAQQSDRPIILALSNPTSKTECTPESALKASSGKALIATGSPFAPVRVNGEQRVISQCNNLYIFPGAGLGALISGTPRITEQMFMAASTALSDLVPAEALNSGRMLPDIERIREVTTRIALAVASEARDMGLGQRADDEHLLEMIEKAMWTPRYVPLRYVQRDLF